MHFAFAKFIKPEDVLSEGEGRRSRMEGRGRGKVQNGGKRKGL